MGPVVRDVKHACVVVSSDQHSTELFQGVFGFPSNGGHEAHIFNVGRGFEMHACAEPIGPITREGWPGVAPPGFPDSVVPRSVIGLTFNSEQVLNRTKNSAFALKLNSFVVPGATAFDPSVVALRDSDDHLWLADEKITRYIPISNRENSSGFYESFLGTARFSSKQDRYHVAPNFDIYLLDATLPKDFQNSSLYQQLSHFCVEVFDLGKLINDAFEKSLQSFQMDSDGNRRDLTSPSDDLSFGYGSVYLYDLDGNLWEFQHSN